MAPSQPYIAITSPSQPIALQPILRFSVGHDKTGLDPRLKRITHQTRPKRTLCKKKKGGKYGYIIYKYLIRRVVCFVRLSLVSTLSHPTRSCWSRIWNWFSLFLRLRDDSDSDYDFDHTQPTSHTHITEQIDSTTMFTQTMKSLLGTLFFVLVISSSSPSPSSSSGFSSQVNAAVIPISARRANTLTPESTLPVPPSPPSISPSPLSPQTLSHNPTLLNNPTRRSFSSITSFASKHQHAGLLSSLGHKTQTVATDEKNRAVNEATGRSPNDNENRYLRRLKGMSAFQKLTGSSKPPPQAVKAEEQRKGAQQGEPKPVEHKEGPAVPKEGVPVPAPHPGNPEQTTAEIPSAPAQKSTAEKITGVTGVAQSTAEFVTATTKTMKESSGAAGATGEGKVVEGTGTPTDVDGMNNVGTANGTAAAAATTVSGSAKVA
ncbi:hypothetical protein J3R30DRAFT_661746 [Lentinula aciculospora]|uniref:Uncharacterized protein n=1 Tax=Lentinula aciculospora TaxID=153920 RepID=A0A9W9DK08_9AGAR|nr:hypothetical protein J3R30DRAFT_661746 [Lentinula aciculospora]